MSQAALGERIGVDRVSVSRYESGKHGVEFDRIEHIAAAFNTHPANLFLMAEYIQSRPTGPLAWGNEDEENQTLLQLAEASPRVFERAAQPPAIAHRGALSASQSTPTQGTPEAGYLRFEHLDLVAACGAGAEPVDHPEVVQEVDVLERWARQTLGVVDSTRVKIITAVGDSMLPTVQPGDIVFVDTSVRSFQAEGVYVLILNNRLLIKRLRMLFDGRLAIQSDNDKAYPTEYVSNSHAEQLDVCGRVLGWWTLKRS